MRSWEHTGFGFDQSVYLAAGDHKGIERLVQYMVRCPFSLARLIKVTDEGAVIYKSEKAECRPFPDSQSSALRQGIRRNFQILPVLDFIAEFTQHIPIKGSHLVRYSGWYSNRSRGLRSKVDEAEKSEDAEQETA
ncbi:MAG: transposase, partial [Planctomycetota bacterium]